MLRRAQDALVEDGKEAALALATQASQVQSLMLLSFSSKLIVTRFELKLPF